MDTVDKQTRSMIMSSVGQKDTGAEKLLRQALHRMGLRYTLHDRRLPGSPDIVFTRFKVAESSFTVVTGILTNVTAQPCPRAGESSGPRNSLRIGSETKTLFLATIGRLACRDGLGVCLARQDRQIRRRCRAFRQDLAAIDGPVL